MKVVIFIVLFFSVFCFSQKNEENKTFYKEALTQIKNDDDKGTKIYEYLIDEIDSLNKKKLNPSEARIHNNINQIINLFKK